MAMYMSIVDVTWSIIAIIFVDNASSYDVITLQLDNASSYDVITPQHGGLYLRS